MTSGVFFQAVNPSEFLAMTVESNSTVNYADAMFTISFTLGFTVMNNSRLTVGFPMSVAGAGCVAAGSGLAITGCLGSGMLVNATLVFTSD
jgi:hypothetical protein